MEILKFTHFAILEGFIARILKYDYDKYFSVFAWGESGESSDAKVKDRYKKITQ